MAERPWSRRAPTPVRSTKRVRGVASVIALCGTAAESSEAIAVALAEQGVEVARPPGAKAIGDRIAQRIVTRAFAAAARLDAVVICPALSVTRGRRRAREDFAPAIDAALKSTFFLAKHALVRLGRAGAGALIVVLPPLALDAGVAERVAADALECMVDALAKAAPSGVRVGSVDGSATADQLAATIGLMVAARSKAAFRAALRG